MKIINLIIDCIVLIAISIIITVIIYNRFYIYAFMFYITFGVISQINFYKSVIEVSKLKW